MTIADNSKLEKEGAIRAQNRSLIMSVAEKEFATLGFKGTTVQKVADKANLPKTNVLYYFKSKDGLYMAVLEQILGLWNSGFDKATVEDDPAEVLASYIAEKMDISRQKPEASKIFAQEIINGAQHLQGYIANEQSSWIRARVAVLRGWMQAGKLKKLDPYYLLFTIWGSSQHYADFSAQISQLRGDEMNECDFEQAKTQLIDTLLTGWGLSIPPTFRSA